MTINILQIGDVHFPEARSARAMTDNKDPAFPASVSARVAGSPLQAVIRKLQHVIGSRSCDAITIMGDLTTRGDKAAYGDCLAYLSAALWQRPDVNLSKSHVLAVPGNHDVNREDALATDISFKFEYINEQLGKFGLSSLSIDEGWQVSLRSGDASVLVLGTNTCIGCGTLRGLPTKVKNAVDAIYHEAILKAANADDLKVLYDELYEVLDTPLISDMTIQWLDTAISNHTGPVIVCGHHNILSQCTPRIAPYTELLNSGLLRRTLLASGRQIIYLHGHIHEDPVEIVTSPSAPSAKVIAVSAPQLVDGFNFLKIHIGETGVPLGFKIERFRASNGVVTESESMVIRLAPLDTNPSPEEVRIMEVVNSQRILYFDQAVSLTNLKPDIVENCAAALMWKSRIKISGFDEGRVNWVLERAY